MRYNLKKTWHRETNVFKNHRSHYRSELIHFKNIFFKNKLLEFHNNISKNFSLTNKLMLSSNNHIDNINITSDDFSNYLLLK